MRIHVHHQKEVPAKYKKVTMKSNTSAVPKIQDERKNKIQYKNTIPKSTTEVSTIIVEGHKNNTVKQSTIIENIIKGAIRENK